jgi:hypothetical protein
MKLFGVVLTMFLILGASVRAQSIPNAQECRARHLFTGQEVFVRQRVGPSFFWAHSGWDPDGWPAITYGPTYFQLPSLMQIFTSYHECGHLVLKTTNEFAANCYALETGPFDDDNKDDIATYHKSIGPIGPQYGGSGAAFWALTVQRCPNAVP